MKIQGPINTKAVIGFASANPDYREALKLAEKLYKKEKRQHTGIGYFSHPTTVGSLLLETGAQLPEMVVSALEDMLTFGKLKASTINEKFGLDVLVMVEALTPVRLDQGDVDYKVYGENLQVVGPGVQTVKLASLLDHICSIPRAKLASEFKLLAGAEELLPYLQNGNAELLRRVQVALRNARA